MTASISLIPESFRTLESTQQAEIKRTWTLGQDDFLKLLMTQLQNQDPMEPMDNAEFMDQMAQFSTVEGITEMGDSIDRLVGMYQSQQMSNNASMIGKQALVDGNWAQLQDGQWGGVVELATAANNLRIDIKSETGEVMASLGLGSRMSGTQEFACDGIKDDGITAPEGSYYLSASAVRDGAATVPAMQVCGTVKSIQLKSGEVTLNVAGQGNVSFDNVKRISQ